MAKVLQKEVRLKKDVHVWLSEQTVDWLVDAARRSGYSKSELIEMAIGEFRKKVKLPDTTKEATGNAT